jgi:hypothetical protein
VIGAGGRRGHGDRGDRGRTGYGHEDDGGKGRAECDEEDRNASSIHEEPPDGLTVNGGEKILGCRKSS